MSPASGEAPTGTQQNSQADLVSAFSQEPDFVVCGSVNGSSAKFLIGTGAAVTVISAQLWEAAKQADDSLNPIPSKKLLNVSGDALQLKGMAAIQMKIAGLEFNVNAVVVQSLAIDAVLGRDFLRKEDAPLSCVVAKMFSTLVNKEPQLISSRGTSHWGMWMWFYLIVLPFLHAVKLRSWV